MANRIYDRHVLAGFSVIVKRPIPWGQSPGLSLEEFTDHSVHPKEWAGFLEAGDRIRFLLGVPRGYEGCYITRVEVRPHDGRKVGNSQQRVWIRWPSDGRRVRGLFRIEEG